MRLLGEYTVASSPGNSALVNVQDNETPVISILSNAADIRFGSNALFSLEASIQPWQPVGIHFTPEETTNTNFLKDYTSTMSDSQDVEFSARPGDGKIIGTLSIPTQQDITVPTNTEGTIVITLETDDNNTTPVDYALNSDPALTTASVTITNTPTPQLEIHPHPDKATEGASNVVKFIVRTNEQPPTNPIPDVLISPSESGVMLRGNTIKYISSTENLTASQPKSLMFIENTMTMKWEAEISFDLRAVDGIDAPNGSVTVSLDPPALNAEYIVAGGDLRTTSKTIHDFEVPKISIAGIDQENLLGGNNAKFTLTSDIQPHQAFKVSYTPSNGPTSDPSNFLNVPNPGMPRLSDSLAFDPATGNVPPYTATIAVPTMDDTANATGEIIVTLVDDTADANGDKNYTLHPPADSATYPRSASVAVIQVPKPELSIIDISSPVTEGGMISFTVKADTNPIQALTFNYTPRNMKGSFLDTNDGASGEFRIARSKMFVQKSGSTDWTTDISIPTGTDDRDTDHGTITILLNDPRPENQGAYTVIADTAKATAMATIHDDEAPEISIANVTQEALAGDNVTFTLSSDIKPWEPIAINFTPSETSTTFLDPMDSYSITTKNSGEMRTTSKLTFTSKNSSPPYTAELTINTQSDPDATAGGTITIELGADDSTNVPTKYQISSTDTTKNDATVMVINKPSPTLSIEPKDTSVNEGQQATFIVFADADPLRALNINFTPMDNSGGDFLKVDTSMGLLASGTIRTATNQMFKRVQSPPSPDEMWSTEITIPTRDPDEVDEEHGSISITLNNAPTDNPYTLNPDPTKNTASVAVNDTDAPEISIAKAAETLAGNAIMFTLTASIEPLDDLEIRYIPTEANAPSTSTPTNFLDPNDPVSNSQKISGEVRSSAELEFTQMGGSQRYTAILSIPTRDDPNAESGSIMVELQADDPTNTIATYTITNESAKIAQNTATASIIDVPIPTLSISHSGTAVREGEIVTFTITATKDPKRDLPINFTPENSKKDYLKVITSDSNFPASGMERSDTILKDSWTEVVNNNVPSTWIAELTLMTRDPDEEDDDHGNITVTLKSSSVSPSDYTVTTVQNEDVAVAPVHDLEEPVITIEPTKTVFAGENAELMLEASIEPWQPVEVRFNPINTTGEFFDFDTLESGRMYDRNNVYTKVIPFTEIGGKYLGTLSIPTKVDPNESTGEITVSIYDDDTNPRDYTFAPIREREKRSATITVNKYPELSIAPEKAELDEGAEFAYFTITSTTDPGAVVVHYDINITGTNFLHADESTGSQTKSDLSFTQLDTTNPISPWTTRLPIKLKARDNFDTLDGEIEVVINEPPSNASIIYTTTSPNNEASITISDIDVPSISFDKTAVSVYNGEMATLTLISNIESTQPHNLVVTATNTTGIFLDETAWTVNSAAMKSIQNVEFTRPEGTTEPYSYTLSIPTKIDPAVSSGAITVELLANSNTNENTYTIGSEKNTATVSVYKVTSLSITTAIAEVAEGSGTLNFTVTSSLAQSSPLEVEYSIIEANSNYRHADVVLGSQTLPLTFSTVEPYTATISVSLRDVNNIDEADGEIIVELIEATTDPTYIVAASPGNSAKTKITDTVKPEFSIASTATTAAGQDAKIVITSSIESTQAHTIRVKATNQGDTNFLDINQFENGVSRSVGDVMFSGTAPDPFISTFTIPTMNDDNATMGEVTVELEVNTELDTYTVAENKKTSTVIVKTVPVLSIEVDSSQVLEGSELIFIVSTMQNPGEEALTINYSIMEENSNYRHTSVTLGPQAPIPLTFQDTNGSSPWVARIPVLLRDADQIDNAGGTITVALIPPDTIDKFAIADSEDENTATAIIRDADVPVLSISDAPVIIAGNNAVFTITSNILTTHPHEIVLTPKNETGEFLNPDMGGASEVERKFPDVSFSQTQPFTATISVSTKVDESNTIGTISVKLMINSEVETYSVATAPADTASVIVTNFGDDAPTLSITDPAPQDEGPLGGGGLLLFNITLSRAVDFPVTVNYTIVDHEGPQSQATRGEDFTLADGSLVFQAGVTFQPLIVSVIGDNTFEPTEVFNIRISVAEGSSVNVAKMIGVGMINNDDVMRTLGQPEISIDSDDIPITEGADAIFTISADRPPNHTAAINVQIQVVEVGTFIGWRAPRILTIPANVDDEELRIPTLNDTTHEPNNGRITVTVLDGRNYNLSPDTSKRSASLVVLDDNDSPSSSEQRISVAEQAVNSILNQINGASAPPTNSESSEFKNIELPTISVIALDQEISEGEVAEFEIIATGELTDQLIVSFVIDQNGDFLTPNIPTQVQISYTLLKARVIINTQNDQIAEPDGSITLNLQQASNYKISSPNSATIAVSDAEDRQLRKDEIANRSSEILPQYLNLIGGNILATTTQRIQNAQTDTNSFSSYQINGAEGITQLITTSGEVVNSNSETLRSIFGNSAFEFDLYSEDNLAHPVSIWGLGELKNVSSTSSSNSSTSGWQGDAFTGHLGFDTKLSPNLLVGMSSSTVDLDTGFASAEHDEFLFRSRSTIFNPYLSWIAPDNDAHLESIVGYGLGEIKIKQQNYQYETLQSQTSNFSLSGSKKLYASDSILTGGTSELNLIGESWIANLQIAEKAGIIDETILSAQHHRVAVNGTHNIILLNGSAISPTLSIGLLHDGKEQNTLRGVEFRNGITYTDPIGLELAGNARLIQEQTSQSKLWNINGSISYDSGRDQLGAILNVTGTYSKAPTNYTSLLNMSIIDGAGSSATENLINSKLQYGFAVCSYSCLVTPYAGYNFDADGLTQSQLGARFSIGSLINFDIEHTHNPNSESETNQKVQFNSRFNW